jgi:ammonia channel protein AmtB
MTVTQLTGLRVEEADETRGLDISIHAREGFSL